MINKINTILINLFGLWVFGMLVGATTVGFLPGEPSFFPAVMLAIGVLGSFGS